jgi:hypothetical protein
MAQIGQAKVLSYYEFRASLYTSLFACSIDARIQYLQLELGGKRAFSSTDIHIHKKTHRRTANPCAWCVYMVKYSRIIGQFGPERRTSRTRSGCSFCDVPLYQNSDCWANYHQINAN